MRMRYCEITCDLETSRDCYGYFGPTRTVGEAVKAARKAGWYVGAADSERDACPECRKDSTNDQA